MFMWKATALQARFEKTRTLEEKTYPKVLIRGNIKICLVRGELVTKRYDRHGIEIMIDSIENDGTQSWVVISRDVE